MIPILFIGDIVGEAGIALLEKRLPALIVEHQPLFVVANAENIALTQHPHSPGNCGMTPEDLERLFALGVDLITGGNHSWDGPHGRSIHTDPRVLRPLNYGRHAPGRGSAIIEKEGLRLGVINLMSRTAMPFVDMHLDVFEDQVAAWEDATDLVLIDFHGESVTEKLSFAFAVDGVATAVLGTHTHVPTLDSRVLPGGTAYITDVGMTGSSGGIQGYAPEYFANSLRLRLPSGDVFQYAEGETELGAVLVRCNDKLATAIVRVV